MASPSFSSGPDGVLLLTEEDVRHLLTMDMALEAVEKGLRGLALDEAALVPRARIQTDHVMLHTMAAAARSPSVLGTKVYTTTRKGARFLVSLFDGRTGALLCLMQADYLGQMRTGAASGIATRYMARPDATELGIFGSGAQARTQLLAIAQVRRLNQVHVYSPNEQNRRRFAEEMSRLCQVAVSPAPRPEMAAEKKDIIVTATTSREPVLNARWISEGTHINAIGANFLSKAELDGAAVRRCSCIVVDSKDQARMEAGDFQQPLEEGWLRWSEVRELGQVVVGRFPARQHPQDITLFKSLGIAIEDVVLASQVYTRASAEQVGQVLSW